MKLAFAIGAGVFLLTIFIYVVFTTSEYPPEDMEAFKAFKQQKSSFVKDIIVIGDMPKTMIRLGVIPNFFHGLKLFTMSMAKSKPSGIIIHL